MRALLLLGVLLLIPAAQACQQVTPMVGFEFPDKEPCTVTPSGGYEGCEPLPHLNESRTYEGWIVWSWDLDQCTTESGYLQGDMVFEFSKSQLSPDWLGITFDPEQIVVPMHEYYDPTNVDVDPNQNRIYNEQRRAVNVTFTNERVPTAGEMAELEDRGMSARVFLKVLGNGEGTAESFGITQFVFDASNDPWAGEAPTQESEPVDQEAPAPPLALLLAALVFLARRRS